MDQAYYFDKVSQYNAFNNHETLHPLVSIIDFSKAKKRTGSRMTFGLYCIFLKQVHCGDLKYGCNYYDYEEGTLVFISPGQVIDVENKIDVYTISIMTPVKGTKLYNEMKNELIEKRPEKFDFLHLVLKSKLPKIIFYILFYSLHIRLLKSKRIRKFIRQEI